MAQRRILVNASDMTTPTHPVAGTSRHPGTHRGAGHRRLAAGVPS